MIENDGHAIADLVELGSLISLCRVVSELKEKEEGNDECDDTELSC